jgi:hypothetical protein
MTVGEEGWRGPILRHFNREIASTSRLTIVADPDDLLTEQRVVEEIRKQGFDLVTFDDHVAFRFAYESRYRQTWDRGEETTLVVVLRAPRSNVESLPFDLLEEARRNSRLLSFSIGELFPRLVPSIVAGLPRDDLDALCEAQGHLDGQEKGQAATADFVLQHVYQVAPAVLRTPADILHALLKIHHLGRRIPGPINDRFVQVLRRSGNFEGWPLEQIVPSRDAFFAFLQERWPRFLRVKVGAGGGSVAESPQGHKMAFAGPDDLPFDHGSIRVFIDDLFVEGLLRPSDAVPKKSVGGTWMSPGVVGLPEDDRAGRLVELARRIGEGLPRPDAPPSLWLEVARRYGEWLSLQDSLPTERSSAEGEDSRVLRAKVEEAFLGWMLSHYGALPSTACWPSPTMVHQIPQFLARGRGRGEDRAGRLAVVVVDGLALAQWGLLRDSLGTGSRVEEGATFAWVPTLTTVSRQAIFAGEAPIYFPTTIDTTAGEERRWKKFWADRDLRAQEVGYTKQGAQEPTAALVDRVATIVDDHRIKALGVVIGWVDETLHGSTLGSRGLHLQVAEWCQQGHFSRLVTVLLDGGFEIVLTSDHGNHACVGIGKPSVGGLAEERGERAHVFSDEATRSRTKAEFPTTIEWPPHGLPTQYFPLLAQTGAAFVPMDRTTVGHGGISLEEVIVPFVRITRQP